MSIQDQAAALEKMQEAFAREKAIVDRIGELGLPGNPENLGHLRDLFAAQADFRAAAAAFEAAGGKL